MDRTTFWVLTGLVAAFALPSLLLAALERTRSLGATPRVDGTVRSPRAFGAMQLGGGALIAASAALMGAWWVVPAGLGIAALGASSFTRRQSRVLEWVGFALLVCTIALRARAR